MNIVEALDVALPELPFQRAQRKLPRVERSLIAREHIEDGSPIVIVLKPKTDGFYRLAPEQWELIQLFDGERSYEKLSELFQEKSGTYCSPEQIREFAELLSDTDLLFKPPGENSLAQVQDLKRQRQKAKKSRFGDLSEIKIAAWDPDVFLTRLYPYVKFIYTRWFSVFSLAMVGFMTFVFVQRWDEIWNDTLQYYTFTEKGLADLAEFWVLFLFVVFFHESAHGMTCKHYGGGVHSMGFLLMYFMPCFFCDASEAWVYGKKWQRLATMVAGIWIELVMCSFITVVWWATAPGMFIHDFAYKLILITGIGVVLLNINPLVKLDGYFMLTELIGIGDLKERSTAYVSSWVKRNVFRLPVDVDFVPRRRRIIFIVYALLSGAYSYLLLFTVVQIVHNILLKYTPAWAWLPALGLTYLIFKSRIHLLVSFMKTVYLDKRERLRAWLTPPRIAAIAGATVLLLFLPLWPDFIQGRFSLEPVQRAAVRAAVAGTVAEIFADEGQIVSAGVPLVRLRNLDLESQAARVNADYRLANARAIEAQLRYSALGGAEQERQQFAEQNRLMGSELAKLEVVSPISGTVVTPRLHDLEGSYLPQGTLIAEVADLSHMRARVYVPEFAMRDLRVGASVKLHLEAFFTPVMGTVVGVAPAPSEMEAGLMEKQQYKGIRPPQFWVATVALNSNGLLREDMAGEAKIYVRRRSIAGFAWRFARDMVGRRVW